MTAREQLIKELEQTPDFLIHEVLDFLLFTKVRLAQRKPQDEIASTQDSFLDAIDQLSASASAEEWADLPNNLSKNLDCYLYGFSKY